MANVTPSGSATAPSMDSDNFNYRLIEAVKSQPCLYNSSHEHYGSKQANAQYRHRVWQKICADLGYNDGWQNLQSHWKKIRDRYVRERKKRRNANPSDAGGQQENAGGRERHPSESSSCSTSSTQVGSPANRQFEMMKWIDPYLGDPGANNNGMPNHSIISETSATAQPSVQQTPSVSTAQPLQGQNGDTATLVVTSVGNTESYYVSNIPVSQQQDSLPVSTAGDGSVSNSFSPPAQQPPQAVPVQQVAPLQSQHDYAAPPRTTLPNGSTGPSKPTGAQSSAAGSPCSSTTSSEIDVGSVATFAGQNQPRAQLQPLQQQPAQAQQHAPKPQQNTIVLAAVPQHQRQSQAPPQQFIFPKSEPQPGVGQSVQTADGSIVTVTARGTAPMTNYVKKDVIIKTDGCNSNTNTWYIDPNSIYQHGTQRMYRLVNLSEMGDGSVVTSGLGPSTSDIKIGSPSRKKMRVAVNAQGLPNGRGQIGDDLIIDDGIAPKTITIEQTASPPLPDDSILHDHHNAISIGNANVMLSHHNVQQVHHQQHASTSQVPGGISSNSHHNPVAQHIIHHGGQINVVSTRQQPTGQRFAQQPITVQPQMQYTVLTSQPLPPHHDEEIEFTNSIAAHLSRLNEDEKAVAKMNIQRILMDARFGIGACARMIHEEEFNEAAVNNAVSHELAPAQQQHVDNTPRR